MVLEAQIYILCVMANRIYNEKDYAPFVFDSYTVVIVQHTVCQFFEVKLGRGADVTVYKVDRSGILRWVGERGCSITAYIIHVRMKLPYTAAIRPLDLTPTHHLTTIHPQTHTNVKKRTQRTQVKALTSLGTTIPSSLKGEATPLSVAAMVRCNSSRMNCRGTTRIMSIRTLVSYCTPCRTVVCARMPQNFITHYTYKAYVHACIHTYVCTYVYTYIHT